MREAPHIAALRLALPDLRMDLEALVACHTVGQLEWAANLPLPEMPDAYIRTIAKDKKAAYDAVVAAIALAEGR